jgi:hypothetical protein
VGVVLAPASALARFGVASATSSRAVRPAAKAGAGRWRKRIRKGWGIVWSKGWRSGQCKGAIRFPPVACTPAFGLPPSPIGPPAEDNGGKVWIPVPAIPP